MVKASTATSPRSTRISGSATITPKDLDKLCRDGPPKPMVVTWVPYQSSDKHGLAVFVHATEGLYKVFSVVPTYASADNAKAYLPTAAFEGGLPKFVEEYGKWTTSVRVWGPPRTDDMTLHISRLRDASWLRKVNFPDPRLLDNPVGSVIHAAHIRGATYSFHELTHPKALPSDVGCLLRWTWPDKTVVSFGVLPKYPSYETAKRAACAAAIFSDELSDAFKAVAAALQPANQGGDSNEQPSIQDEEPAEGEGAIVGRPVEEEEEEQEEEEGEEEENDDEVAEEENEVLVEVEGDQESVGAEEVVPSEHEPSDDEVSAIEASSNSPSQQATPAAPTPTPGPVTRETSPPARRFHSVEEALALPVCIDDCIFPGPQNETYAQHAASQSMIDRYPRLAPSPRGYLAAQFMQLNVGPVERLRRIGDWTGLWDFALRGASFEISVPNGEARD